LACAAYNNAVEIGQDLAGQDCRKTSQTGPGISFFSFGGVMRTLFGGRRMVWLAVVCAMLAYVPASQARSAKSVEKQAQKIEKKLAKYKAGSYLHLVFSDNTESSGSLGALSDTTFSFTNTESNVKETHRYSDVERVEKGKVYIGQGSEHHHHRVLF
jgi:hypothetical protein